MSDATKALKSAIGAYADFNDLEVRKGVYILLDALDSDLDIGAYTPSSECEQAIANLQDIFDDKVEEEEVAEGQALDKEDAAEDSEVEAEADAEVEEVMKDVEGGRDRIPDDEDFSEIEYETEEELE